MSLLGPRTRYDAETGIYSCTVTIPTLPERTVYEQLLGSIDFQDADNAFTECISERTISFGELKSRAQRLGLGLLRRAGLKPGDVVLVMLPSSIDFVVVIMAAQFAGLRVALANPDYLATELRHAYRLVKPKKVFLTSSHFHKASKANIASFQLVFTNYRMNRAGVLSVEQLLESHEDAVQAKPHVPASLNETAYLPFSSGTTGMPKAVEITHRNIIAMLEIAVHNPGFLPDNGNTQLRLLSFLPFFHAYALVGQVHIGLRVKGHVAILRPFDPVRFCKEVKKQRANLIQLVPPVLTLLSKHPSATREAFADVSRANCGAAPLDADTQGRFAEKTGLEVTQGWGMTETTVGGLGLSDVQGKPGAAGCLLPATEAKIVDVDTGKTLGPGERGELWIRGGQVCKGYFANPEATAQTITPDGFLKTGDIAVVDAETGEFSVVDRLKELIKYKGFQVPPAELEGVLVTHPHVAAAAVVGVYSNDQGTELPLAFLELKQGVPPSQDEARRIAAEIDAFVRGKVSHHKYLRGGIEFLPKVPVSASGKVLRKEIRKMLQARIAAANDAEPARARL
ncbi:acetyl-CoA synthetase-like protein [Testicularia cyperi]|uniref:Acetyl-CoA synthetase-like protein n=1 Tax=Testicularia cyperi TaxID=1882483 RepID=A0A317XIP6_9BASI|nr:acetyl-CoA synthetase-like protein [Testicularia cyperi]